MTVEATSALSSAATAGSSDAAGTSSNTALDQDDFMKILLAQLANQDPTTPTDSTEFVSELAQFSQLQDLQGVGTSLDNLLVATTSSLQEQATAFVGKDVVFKGGSVTLTSGQPAPVVAQLGGDAADVKAVITNAAGQTVRTLDLGPEPAGPLAFAWDGRDDSGQPLPSGTYGVQMSAADVTGAAVGVAAVVHALVTGVAFDGGAPVLITSAGQVQLANVTEIDQAQ